MSGLTAAIGWGSVLCLYEKDGIGWYWSYSSFTRVRGVSVPESSAPKCRRRYRLSGVRENPGSASGAGARCKNCTMYRPNVSGKYFTETDRSRPHLVVAPSRSGQTQLNTNNSGIQELLPFLRCPTRYLCHSTCCIRPILFYSYEVIQGKQPPRMLTASPSLRARYSSHLRRDCHYHAPGVTM